MYAVLLSAVLMLIVLSCAARAEAKPRVMILGTGGTIAGTAGSSTQLTEYRAGSVGVDELIAAVPAIADIADITGAQVCNVASPNITQEDWFELARRCNEALAGDVDGVVITHGTDTLEETAWFLDLVVKSDKPVILVGSMRPATAISSDGPLNLLNAVGVAADPSSRGYGVTIVMNDVINAARDVAKTNTLRVETFQTRDLGALGYVVGQRPVWFRRPTRPHTTASEFSVKGGEPLPRVDIIYASICDSSDELYRASVAQGARGVVLCCPGNGSVPGKLRDAVIASRDGGPAVVRVSRVGSGIVTPSSRDEEPGIIAGGTLPAMKARILLQLALAKTDDRAEIRRIFAEY